MKLLQQRRYAHDYESAVKKRREREVHFFSFFFPLSLFSLRYSIKSCFAAFVITSQPPSRRMSTSSILTPNLPGRYMPGSADITAPSGIGVFTDGDADGDSWI